MGEASVNAPDVGYAWVIAFSSFMMQACSVGFFSGFGTFLDYYRREVFPEAGYSELAIIGTLQAFVMGMGSIATGRLCQHFGVKLCVYIGSALLALSLILASFATQVWHLILTQGVLFGLGGSFIYVPANVAIAQWFEARRGFAAGIGASGGGAGGLIVGVINSKLLPELKMKNALRVNAAVLFILLMISAALVKPRECKSYNKREDGFHLNMITNLRFALFSLASFIGGCAYMIPLTYVASYATENSLSNFQGGWVGGSVNLGSAVGRILMGLLGDQIGYVNSYTLALLLASLALFIWRFSTAFVWLIVFGITYGLPSGGWAGGFAPVCGAVFGKAQLATLMGISYAFVGTGELVGPIFGGYLKDKTKSFHYTIYFTITAYFLSFVAMVCVKYCESPKLPHTTQNDFDVELSPSPKIESS